MYRLFRLFVFFVAIVFSLPSFATHPLDDSFEYPSEKVDGAGNHYPTENLEELRAFVISVARKDCQIVSKVKNGVLYYDNKVHAIVKKQKVICGSVDIEYKSLYSETGPPIKILYSVDFKGASLDSLPLGLSKESSRSEVEQTFGEIFTNYRKQNFIYASFMPLDSPAADGVKLYFSNDKLVQLSYYFLVVAYFDLY